MREEADLESPVRLRKACPAMVHLSWKEGQIGDRKISRGTSNVLGDRRLRGDRDRRLGEYPGTPRAPLIWGGTRWLGFFRVFNTDLCKSFFPWDLWQQFTKQTGGLRMMRKSAGDCSSVPESRPQHRKAKLMGKMHWIKIYSGRRKPLHWGWLNMGFPFLVSHDFFLIISMFYDTNNYLHFGERVAMLITPW